MKTQGNFFGDATKIQEKVLPLLTLSEDDVQQRPALLLCFMTAKALSVSLFF
ncbi:MAG: hypothetical protein K1X81_09740 [Bacteroidia bacterium]|nr:hypothetical protein [Bacteroidia bacterium]